MRHMMLAAAAALIAADHAAAMTIVAQQPSQELWFANSIGTVYCDVDADDGSVLCGSVKGKKEVKCDAAACETFSALSIDPDDAKRARRLAQETAVKTQSGVACVVRGPGIVCIRPNGDAAKITNGGIDFGRMK